MATLVGLLLVSLAIALIVLVVVALPHLQSGEALLSAEGGQRARRGMGRLSSWLQGVVGRVGESIGTGIDALLRGPAGRAGGAVGQHGAGSLPAGPDGRAGVEEQQPIGPRHASR